MAVSSVWPISSRQVSGAVIRLLAGAAGVAAAALSASAGSATGVSAPFTGSAVLP
jgi:hypothetical protein